MKYRWGNFYGETYKPKANKKRQLGLLGFMLSAITADIVIPCTFGQITRRAYKSINTMWVYC